MDISTNTTCGRPTVRPTPVNHHMNKESAANTPASSSSQSVHATSEPKKHYFCSQCRYTTHQRGRFEKHTCEKQQRKSKPAKSTSIPISSEASSSNSPADSGPVILNGVLSQHIIHCLKCDYKTSKKTMLDKHICGPPTLQPVPGPSSENSSSNTSASSSQTKQNQPSKPSIGSQAFRCSQCHFKTSHIKFLQNHESLHTTKSAFQCHLCTYSVNNSGHLTRHVGRDHLESERSPDVSEDPQMVEKNRAVVTIGPSTSGPAGMNGELEKEKNLPVPTPLKVGRPPKGKSPKSKPARSKAPKTPGKHACKECEFSTRDLSHFTSHEESHKRNGKSRCPHCSYSAPSQHFIKMHVTRYHRTAELGALPDASQSIVRPPEHSPVPIDSTVRALPSVRRKSLDVVDPDGTVTHEEPLRDRSNHVDKHQEREEPRSSGSQQRMSSSGHNSTATKPRVRRCPKCSFTARDSASLQEHMLSHQSEPALQCSACDYRGQNRADIVSHIHRQKEKGNRAHSNAKAVTVRLTQANESVTCRSLVDMDRGASHRRMRSEELDQEDLTLAYSLFRKLEEIPSLSGRPASIQDLLVPITEEASESAGKRMRMQSPDLHGDVISEDKEDEETVCRKDITVAGVSLHATYRSMKDIQKGIDRNVVHSTAGNRMNVESLRRRVEAMKEEVRTRVMETQKLSVRRKDLRKIMTEATSKKLRAEIAVRTLQCDALKFRMVFRESNRSKLAERDYTEAQDRVRRAEAALDRIEVELESLKEEEESLMERMLEVDESLDSSSKALRAAQEELKAHDASAPDTTPQGAGNSVRRLEQLQIHAKKQIHHYESLHERLVRIVYRKTVDLVRQKEANWLQTVKLYSVCEDEADPTATIHPTGKGVEQPLLAILAASE